MSSSPPAATVIAGRYEVLGPLGDGSFGEVVKVFDHYLQQTVALKLLRTIPSGWNVWTEAQVLSQLQGEYILPVRNADLVAGEPYVVSDLATHGSVADRLRNEKWITPSRAVRWIRQACQGVARIHDHGMVHRDIKPENLFLDSHEDVLVGDLGLAGVCDSQGLDDAAGTPTTMAPEVARIGVKGEIVTTTRVYSARSDIYSLGATLFWLLAGCQPIQGGATSYVEAWSGARMDLWEVAPHVTQGLRDIVNRAISSEPTHRYASAAEFDAALGGRNVPKREWVRVEPHPGHEACFEGVTRRTDFLVCASQTGKGTQMEISAQRASSGRRVPKAGGIASKSQLPAALRRTFRLCS